MILVDLLMWAARALVFASAAGVLVTVLRVKRAAVLLTGWTIVLYGVLAMPVMTWVVPDVRWSIPVVLPRQRCHRSRSGTCRRPSPRTADRLVRASTPATSAPPSQSAAFHASPSVNPLHGRHSGGNSHSRST